MHHSLEKILNKENSSIIASQKTTKEEFLLEHNKLAPLNLQATTTLLSSFREDKALIFKNDDWPIDKLRRPFILWLTSLPIRRKENIKKKG
ncbi:MAG: hypothetical protein AAB565_00525 [Patescibacteria group bacterium]